MLKLQQNKELSAEIKKKKKKTELEKQLFLFYSCPFK